MRKRVREQVSSDRQVVLSLKLDPLAELELILWMRRKIGSPLEMGSSR